MRIRIVPELRNEGMLFQDGLHNGALRAASTPVNQAQLAQAGFMRGADVLIHDRGNVTR